MKKNHVAYLAIIMLAALVCVYMYAGRTPATEANVTTTTTPMATAIPNVAAEVTVTVAPTATATAIPTATPTTIPTATPTTIPTTTTSKEVNQYNHGSITVADLFGKPNNISAVPNTTSEISGIETLNENIVTEENENGGITVEQLFGKKTQKNVEPKVTPELEVYTNIELTPEVKTLNPVNFGANTNDDGFQLCSVLLNNNGNMIAIENQYELGTRKMTLTALEAGKSSISQVVIPKDNASDRLNGRFVRSKKPHEVIVNDGMITAGFSQVPLKLEVVDARLLEELMGKPASEVTAQDIVSSTIVVENHDGKWIAAHKSAPGYRGPLVAKLHLENGRWLRVEKWNWTINEGDRKEIGIPSLVFVMCSDRDGRTPI